jgi:hypothetical protein
MKALFEGKILTGDKEMKNLFVGLLAIILVSLAVQAQVASNNSRETVEDTEHGYSFTAPANWSVEKSEGKCAGVILANPADTINIVVKPHHSNSLANFFKNESNMAGEGFRQVGEVRELANNMKYVRVYKSTKQSDVLLDIIFIPFSSQGGAVVMNFTISERSAEEAMKESIDIVKSMRYSAPQSAEQAQPEAPQQSSSQGGGNSLFASKRFYAESGSSQTEILLCPSGSYRKNSNFFFSGGTSTDFENGSWRVQESGGATYLVLVSAKGEQTNYQIGSQSNGYIMLNNRRYSMSNYNGCR